MYWRYSRANPSINLIKLVVKRWFYAGECLSNTCIRRIFRIFRLARQLRLCTFLRSRRRPVKLSTLLTFWRDRKFELNYSNAEHDRHGVLELANFTPIKMRARLRPINQYERRWNESKKKSLNKYLNKWKKVLPRSEEKRRFAFISEKHIRFL